jgi:hypothetical protein
MTSPHKRKKRAAFLRKQQSLESTEQLLPVTELAVAEQTGLVVDSVPQAPATPAPKVKKTVAKNGLVELEKKEAETSDQVVEQDQPEVKTLTGE